jgi:hypothetical protein
MMRLPWAWVNGFPALRRIWVRLIPRLAVAVALVGLLASLATGTSSAIELRDAELIASGSVVLQNGSGTVQLVDARMGRLGPTTLVPEPGALWQLGSGIGLLALLGVYRRRRTAPDTLRRGIPR